MTMQQSGARAVDPFTLEIIRNHLITTCEEMGLAMMRTSYSPMFNEALDFSCVLFDRDLEMVAQAPFVPSQIGSTVHVVPAAVREVGVENLRPGDVVFTNDPYRGNCHLPEFVLIMPHFDGDEIVAYSANIAHMTDVGGMVPAAFGNHRNVFQEGIRIPPIKLFVAGKEAPEPFRILLSNVRMPDHTYGDLLAMRGSLLLAGERVAEVVRRYGRDTFVEACREIKDISEELMRAEIRSWPDGEYHAQSYIEDDGVVPNRKWLIDVIVRVQGDELIVDFSGSDPQCLGPGNQTFGTTASSAYNAVLQICERDIAYNQGCYRPIHVVTRPGTLMNARFPAPTVGGNTESHPTTVDTILKAIGQFSDRVPASDGATSGTLGFGGVDAETGRPFAYLHLEGVGWGGWEDADGNDVQFTKNGNCPNTPIEVAETRYPILTLQYELAEGRVGHGRHRGGFGSKRVMRILRDGVYVSSSTNRHIERPWGLRGGEDGANTVLGFRGRGESEWRTACERYGAVSPGKFANLLLAEGDEILFIMPSGGGYGPPRERDPELVAEDVAEGLIDELTAREVYAVALTEDGAVDTDATNVLRGGASDED